MAAMASLSEGAIVGIAVAGSTALLLALVSTGLHIQKNRDQKLRERLLHIESGPLETKELAAFLRSDRPRDDYNPNSFNVVPSLPPHRLTGSVHVNTVAPAEELYDEPPLTRANTKRLSPTRALSRLSTGFRDSWPLANSGQVPNALHGLAKLQSQSQSTITLNQVAPPGYLITSDPKYPNRTYSRSSKTKVSKDVVRNYRPLEPGNRHTSQLTTILRSTSERLKPSQNRRKSLSRTLTSFSRSGPPPTERAPSPNGIVRLKESREPLINNRSTPSITSSIFDEQLLQKPSPEKKVARKVGKVYYKHDVSPPSPSGTDDSLCGINTVDQAIVVPLSSPSRQIRGEKGKVHAGVSPVRMSPVDPKEYPSMLRKENRASLNALGDPIRQGFDAEEYDPFYCTNSTRSKVAGTKAGGPRPLFIRKSTASISNQFSPLKDISGNSQTPRKRESVSVTFDVQHNPFQWSPIEASRSSPISPQPRKKGHKRSKTVRMSVIPAALSSVSIVPEESEESESEQSPFKYHVPSPGVRIVEPSKSPSPSPGRSLLQRRQQNRSPSLPTFNSHIQIPPIIPMGRTMNSSIGDVQIYFPTMPSPTKSSPGRKSPFCLSPMRLSHTFDSDFDFVREEGENSPKLSPSTTHSRRECSIVPAISPTALLDEMIGFAMPPTAAHTHQPKQSIRFVPASFSVLPTTKSISVQTPSQIRTTFPQTSKSPALSPNSEILNALKNHKVPQPVLTLPTIPSHLTRHCELPPRCQSPKSPGTSSPARSHAHKVPRNHSLHQSICMLRRMNSDVSRYESPTSTYSRTERSPTSSPSSPRIRKMASRRETGSIHYHNLLNSTNHRYSASSSISKHRISKHSSTAERRASKNHTRRQPELRRELSLRDMSSDPETEYIVDATPLDPIVLASSSPITEPDNDCSPARLPLSPMSRASIIDYSLPDLSIVGGADREEILELESPVRAQDWSDNIPKNNYPIQSSKREPPGTWSNIILTPTGEESKENGIFRKSGMGISIANTGHDRSVRSSIISNDDHRSSRNSAVSNNRLQVQRNSIGINDRTSEIISVTDTKDHVHHDKASKEKDRKKRKRSNVHSPTDRGSPNRLRRKPGTILRNWNDSPRDSLYDSDGFLRSSPARLSGYS